MSPTSPAYVALSLTTGIFLATKVGSWSKVLRLYSGRQRYLLTAGDEAHDAKKKEVKLTITIVLMFFIAKPICLV